MDINESMDRAPECNLAAKRDYSKYTCFFTLITACSSTLAFLVILVCAIIFVPKAVKLMGTAQSTLENLREVSEELSSMNISVTIQDLENNTAAAMQDVSESMEHIQTLDIDSLNQSIAELKESVEKLNYMFGK